MDLLENEVPHFLDIKISPLGLTIYRKNTYNGQYNNFESYSPWSYKVSWIRSLVTRAKQICGADLLSAEIENIKKFASWNGYPKSIRNAIIKRTSSKSSRQDQLYNYDDMIKLCINLTYMGNAGEQLVRSCIKKLKRNIRKDVQVKFVGTYNTTKLSFNKQTLVNKQLQYTYLPISQGNEI